MVAIASFAQEALWVGMSATGFLFAINLRSVVTVS